MKKERIKKEGSEENKEKRRKLVMNQSSPLVTASPLNRIFRFIDNRVYYSSHATSFFLRYQWKPRSQKKFKLGVTEKDWVDYLNYLLNMATQTTDQQNALKDAMARAKQVHT